jgi:hypothetical protein
MALKSFSTPRSRTDREKVVEFDLDGTLLTARRPKTATFLALAEFSDGGNGWDQMHAVRTFMEESLEPESRTHVQDRLADPDDEFDLEDIVPIVNWMVTEFSTRPTSRPSGSPPPRKRTGKASTARSRSKASTPSDSPSPDSSTP